MIVILENVAQVERPDLRHDVGPDRCADQRHVDDAEFHLVNDIGFLTELVVRKELCRDLPIGGRSQARQEQIVLDPRSRKLRLIRKRGRDRHRGRCPRMTEQSRGGQGCRAGRGGGQ